MTSHAVRFTFADVERANWDWRCSCGPAALAAICGLTLDEVRPHFLPAFPGWTTPTRMFEALRRTGRHWSNVTLRVGRTPWPIHGLARIQWEGPWTQPGASLRWAYTHTHWVGVGPLYTSEGEPVAGETCVWDVNQLDATGCREGWAPLRWWTAVTAPRLTRDIPRATGGWRITHAIEVGR